ncbi:MAG: serine/threonine protein kinase [Myxococcales bacterium]|nr:serine/threonine protein kinase [Myxococcales bacterium]
MSTLPTETLCQGRFQLLDVLGEGGMANVYRAFDRRLQRYRAIKILAPHLAQRESVRLRFLAEAQAMATLEESRVVRIFDMGEDEGRVYIVMELVEGGSLADRIHGAGRLPARLTAQVGVQIAESVDAAHQVGVIHRDIKPHNILLTRTGEIRITDFGIAQVRTEEGDGMTSTGAVMGTWGFMAPEQRSNAKGVDARADVYSIGATLWGLVSGQMPAELYAEEEAFRDIAEPLAGVLRTATRYRREDRYASARALADALRDVLTALPPDTEVVPPLVLPRDRRAPQPPESATLDPSGDPIPPLSTMIPDHGPDPSLTLRRPALDRAALDRAAVDRAALGRPALEPLALNRPAAGAPPTGSPPQFASIPSSELARARPTRVAVAAPLSARLAVWAAAAVLVALTVVRVATLVSAPSALPLGPQIGPGRAPEPAVAIVGSAQAPDVALTEPPVDEPPVDELPAHTAGVGAAAGPTLAVAKAPVVAPRLGAEREPSPSGSAAPEVAAGPAPEEVIRVRVTASDAGRLQHSPPATIAAGAAVTLTATGSANWTVKVYYRGASGGGYSNKLMNASGTSYSTTLKASEALAGGVEYFLQATTPDGTVKDGSASSPHRISVQ